VAQKNSILFDFQLFISKNVAKRWRIREVRKIREIAEIKIKKEENGEKKEVTLFEGLTMYHARYSWATIADSLDIQEKTISKGLGHVDKSLAGKKYIVYDWSKVDKANRQVIGFVIQK